MLPTTLTLTHMPIMTLLTQSSNGFYNGCFSLHQGNLKEHQKRSSTYLSTHIIEQWGRAINTKNFLRFIALSHGTEMEQWN